MGAFGIGSDFGSSYILFGTQHIMIKMRRDVTIGVLDSGYRQIGRKSCAVGEKGGIFHGGSSWYARVL